MPLKPGPELDAQIAEKVFGQHVHTAEEIRAVTGRYVPLGLVVDISRGDNAIHVSFAAEYSGSMEAAWKVWEHCRARYGHDAFARALMKVLDIRDTGYTNPGAMALVAVALVVRSLTPEAICEAALALAEETQEEPNR